MTENEKYTVKKWYNESAIYEDGELFAIVDVRMQAKKIAHRLNEQEARINELKETIIKIAHSYHRKHDNTIVNLVDEIYEENIGDLFIEWNGDVE